jgi:isopentenyldiphosphate isomerase
MSSQLTTSLGREGGEVRVAYAYDGWMDGWYTVDLEEVADAKFLSIKEVRDLVTQTPQQMTPWGLHDVKVFLAGEQQEEEE